MMATHTVSFTTATALLAFGRAAGRALKAMAVTLVVLPLVATASLAGTMPESATSPQAGIAFHGSEPTESRQADTGEAQAWIPSSSDTLINKIEQSWIANINDAAESRLLYNFDSHHGVQGSQLRSLSAHDPALPFQPGSSVLEEFEDFLEL